MAYTVIEDEAGAFFLVAPGGLAAEIGREVLAHYGKLGCLNPSREGWNRIEGDEFELIRTVADCPECQGERRIEVLDTRRITPVSTDPPTKMIDCPECKGAGYTWEYARRFVTRSELESMTEEGLP